MLDNIIIALQSLRSNKMRALLTMLGIIIGIGSVIAIKTVGSSLSGSISNSMSGFGASDITVSLTQKDTEGSGSGVRVRMFQSSKTDADDRITDDMLAEYTAAFPERVKYIKLSETVGTGMIGFSEESATVSVMGINDVYLEAEEIEVLYGRGIQNGTDGSRRLCVVAESFVEDYLYIPPKDAVGQMLTIMVGSNNAHTFYIAGVYDTEETAEDETESEVTSLYIPMETAKKLSGSGEGYESVTIVAEPGTDTAAFMQTTEDFFASYYTRNDTWTASASSMEELLESLTEMIDTVALAISAIAAISLLVGGIGVMNIMLVSVTERTREIGIRKALGARRATIRFQFIVEAVVICLIGGVLGMLLGILLGAVASNLLGYSARADIGAIVLSVGFSMAIGVFFGYYPANKASKLDPIEALRYE